MNTTPNQSLTNAFYQKTNASPNQSLYRDSDWLRVSRSRPCPICGKPDWCLIVGPTDDPTAAICARVESGNRRGDAGWLHRLRDDGRTFTPTLRIPVHSTTTASIYFGAMAERFSSAVDAGARGEPARHFCKGFSCGESQAGDKA